MRTVLVAGFNTRHICLSARRAGFRVLSLERFGDRDLLEIADEVVTFESEASFSRIKGLVERFAGYDSLVLGPGFELCEFNVSVPVLNNDARVVEKVSDKLWLSEFLEELGVKHPATWLLEDVSPSEVRYPVMLKPRRGAGGVENRLVQNREQLEAAKRYFKDFIVQEYLEGVTASVSLIASGGEARSIATSEQISGFPWLTNMPYAYCGNITPFHGRHVDSMRELAEFVAGELRLVGSNGVDFLITDSGVVLLEVNPRFQGTLETVERAYGVSVFSMHVEAFSGVLPQPTPAKCFAGKAVVFSKKHTLVDRQLSDSLFNCYQRGYASDIPCPGTEIGENEPVVTLLSEGIGRDDALEKLKCMSRNVEKRLG
jgi:hypothetical protein